MKALLALVVCACAHTAVFGSLRGVVHDPHHRPAAGARVSIQASGSDYSLALTTADDGTFEAVSLPVGVYRVTVTRDGFAPAAEDIVITSGHTTDLHIALALGEQRQEIEVAETALSADTALITPATLVSRGEIEQTPGADLTNSLNAITDYVPGAWIAHDQLHVRGGHQVTWAIDGVPVPNTNIASNVGPQFDPKDIDYLEVDRGGYSAALGDRTYGVFNAVPRTGFERQNEGELVSSFGSFLQTDDQLSLGSHTEKLAWYGSVNANRSDYGLETPGPEVTHDLVWGLGGMGSLIYNHDPANQLRFVTALRRDDYQVPSTDTDTERERDALAVLSWAHTFRPGLLLTVSPFYHYNRADYDGVETQNRGSQYGGGQAALDLVSGRHDAQAGIYAFAQRDDEAVALPELAQKQISSGYLEAAFLGDQYRVTSWLMLTGGVRLTHFAGAVAENAATPRLGAALRMPRLGWTLRGFWGRYYQAPPLSTISGQLLAFTQAQGLGFIALHGERDREVQFGLTVPVRGWSVDLNRYDQRATNYFDHNAIGDSNVFFPLTIAGARLRGWEVAVRSPRLWRSGEIYWSYAFARAAGHGAITGGLTDFSPPPNGYFFLDHDQRHTLHVGFHFQLPAHVLAGANWYYGSGFTDGSSDLPAHLPGHNTCDLWLGRSFGEAWTVSVTALNAGNRRFPLDNSPTFGGTHYADPRQVYVQMRYRFKF
jgi:hypothetical protein